MTPESHSRRVSPLDRHELLCFFRVGTNESGPIVEDRAALWNHVLGYLDCPPRLELGLS